MTRDRGSRRAERVYRWLLRVYPRAFRVRNGEEMCRVFLERRAEVEREGRGLGRFWVATALDVLRNGLGTRRDARRARGIEGGDGTRGHTPRGGGMDGLIKDVRYAMRTLLRSPGFALVAVLTIAVGIGANTAIFSVVRAVLLAPLPYEEPEELVILWGEMRNRDVTHFPHSPPDFRDYAEGADLLDDLAGVFTFPMAITGVDEPEQLDAGLVTHNFFSLLGVEPALGRTFLPEDGVPNEPGVAPGAPGSLPILAILSHATWQRRFGSDPGVVGTTIELGGAPAEIVGVMPAGFQLLMPPEAALADDVDIWLAARLDYENSPRNNVFIRAVGRLRDGATAAQLQPQVDRISAALARDDQVKQTAGYAVRVEEMQADVTASVRPVLLALFGAVVFVLLITCANVSNLLLVRASRRERELAVRAAMGGSRGRLIRQLLLESGLLALLGALLGLGVAQGGIELLLALRPDNLPRLDSVRIDGLVLAFTLIAAAGAALLFGVVPALQASRIELADALKDRGSTGGARRKLVRNGVVVAEVSLSLVLLIGAGLMLRSFVALAQVEPGYEPEGVLTFGVPVPFASYPQAVDRANLQLEVRRRLEALPGVERVGGVFPLPLSGALFNGRYGTEEALADPAAFRQASYRAVVPGYFEAMGTRLLAGRLFTDADYNDSTNVAIVDEVLAERLWPATSAVGERFLIRAVTQEPEWVEVIGVVEHQRSESLAARGIETVFVTDRYIGSFGNAVWTLRASVPPQQLVPAIRAELESVDPNLPLADVRLMSAYVDDAMGPTRFSLTLIGVFGVIALVLASVGLYGVLAYAVRQRTAEIGVRMAFGAEHASILGMVVKEGLALALVGVGVGLVAAFPLTNVVRAMLVGVAPTDPLTFAAVSGIFILVAAAACYVPARRATRVDPVTSLRDG